MGIYRMKNCEVEAVEIDAKWLSFLSGRSDVTGISLGDYWVRCIDGIERVMGKKEFERIFFKIDTNDLALNHEVVQ